jgi:hypothetical protein
MVFVAELTFGGNFFIGGKSAELRPFSTVSQVILYFHISLLTARVSCYAPSYHGQVSGGHRFSPDAPLPISAGSESLSSTAGDILVLGVWYAQIYEKLTFADLLIDTVRDGAWDYAICKFLREPLKINICITNYYIKIIISNCDFKNCAQCGTSVKGT